MGPEPGDPAESWIRTSAGDGGANTNGYNDDYLFFQSPNALFEMRKNPYDNLSPLHLNTDRYGAQSGDPPPARCTVLGRAMS